MTTKLNKIHVVIIGAGFAGINAAKKLGNKKEIEITIIDKKNYHLFQPLLYQVAMAGLSPAEITSPIRTILAKYKNINVVYAKVTDINLNGQTVLTDFKNYKYDYLIIASGSSHSYFGKNEWEDYAPGMKTIEQATEIRRRVLTAFELAERETDKNLIDKFLTFAVVGGGPTGVEITGSLCEIAHFTLNKEFKNIDPRQTKIYLIEAGQTILSSFSDKQAAVATMQLKKIGASIITGKRVEDISSDGILVNSEFIPCYTVIWAAGVQPSILGKKLNSKLDKQGRVIVEAQLNLKNYPNVFVIGDLAHCLGNKQKPLPGLAPVAIQQGCHASKNILRNIAHKPMQPFQYFDKGQMATIGRGSAIVEFAGLSLNGKIAWFAWLLVHILYLIGFKNKFFVLYQWAWSYMTYGRGARLITSRQWKNKTS
ncbi:MAG: NAD(P)/FAD-dependent oxidoreductase [Spirobacillus cienkowskii]|jgi:NADH dehydrogenase|uniref:NADH:ubiquinone reductase (non-electrogenic) n=1 Tax=Spirobacillus cienkowskii TaxID=495820 RepID=A0A369KNZ5_9BACT|nr:MAG: NAD(P)/FAD-dependent oxidoreductase [Spirobacillus cienkowskii]